VNDTTGIIDIATFLQALQAFEELGVEPYSGASLLCNKK
jgi:hypothetical protein